MPSIICCMASSSQLDKICYIRPQLSLPVFCRSNEQKYENSNLEETFFKFHIEGYFGCILQQNVVSFLNLNPNQSSLVQRYR